MYSFVIISIIAICVDSKITHFCKGKLGLVSTDEMEDYTLAGVEINTTVVLECRFCTKTIDPKPQPKIWYWQDRYQIVPEKCVEIGMDNNASLNRIRTTPELSLVIRDVGNNDTGIYKCRGEEGQEAENKFYYKLETVFKDETLTIVEKGNITEWETYREIHLKPVTTRFAVSKMKEIAEIRRSGVILEVISDWSPWEPCGNCIRNRGVKTSLSLCRLKRRLNNTSDGNSTILEFFKTVPILPCRSTILGEKFPKVSQAVRFLPSFTLVQKCKNCVKVKKPKRLFKYKKRHVLLQGTHLVSACPEANVDSQVVWRKDGLILKKGTGQSFRKNDPNARIIVDAFSTLYLIDVSKKEEGNYTCYVDEAYMMSMKVIVHSKSRLLTEAFLRHSGYLGFIFLLTSFCYCAGLFAAYQRKDEFRNLSYEKLVTEKTESEPSAVTIE